MTSKLTDFSNSTDEMLINMAQNGDSRAENCIIERYRDAVKITAASFVGSFADSRLHTTVEFDDLFQEGLLGLLSAVYSFRDDKNTSFRTYSSRCISNSIKNAIKAMTRQKNTPTGSVVSLSEVDISVNASPEDRIISAEGTEIIFDFLQNQLSPLELSVIKYHLSGTSYKEIALKLDITEKSVDNAVQRTRNKLGRFLDKE